MDICIFLLPFRRRLGRLALCALLPLALASLSSCASVSSPFRLGRPVPPSLVMGRGQMGERRLVSFFLGQNRHADRDKVRRLASLYIEEARAEGVNADVAFVQMCLETGFLRFGGLVTEDMNNFCGLGSIGPGQPGNRFPDERTGVRAHIQHLKAYGSAEPLAAPAVDPRYRYVNPKGKAPAIASLAGTWAMDPAYGTKLAALLDRLYGRV